MMTVSITGKASYLKWSCSSTLMRSSLRMDTLPVVGASSPDMMRSRVDLPAPLAPMMP